MKTILGTFGTLTLTLALIGCQPPAEEAPATTEETPAATQEAPAADTAPAEEAAAAPQETEEQQTVRVAIAELQPTEGNEASGTVTFTRIEGGIQVVVDISGLGDGPNQRGFHIHEHGDCSAPDGTSAGGHFNPENAPHGAPDSDERHIGDLGNLTVEADGTARAEFIDPLLTFDGPNSILDRAVIVHAQEDDLESQPTGDAGGRVACGVIQIAEYEN